jgi:glycosyltransferase involved in cell wall biosynthesis
MIRTRKQRVAVVIDTVAPWSVGGRESRYEALLDRFPALGLDVTVYTMRWWRVPPSGPVRYRAIAPRMKLYKGQRRSILQSVVFAIGTLQLFFRRFDVIEADHMPYLHLFPLRLVAWVRRVDLVVDWHEYWGQDYWKRYLGRAGGVAAALERMSAQMADTVVPVTKELATTLLELGISPDRIVVVPNAVDRRRLEAVVPRADAPELLVVGRLLPHKRTELAIRAMAELDPTHRSVRLGIVGEGPERERLEALASGLGIQQRVVFYGALARQEDVWELMKGARVLVFPSEREGFGLVAAESQALGTPVVCIDGPDNKARHLIVDGSTGTLVPTASPTALAEALTIWLGDPHEREFVAREFWDVHDDLDWDASAARYAHLLSRRS